MSEPVCRSERDGEVCVRSTPHAEFDQHRGASGRRWYFGDDMQRGMPRRYIYDHTPLVVLVRDE